MNSRIAMDRTYWLRQTAEKPLFPDILWSRPENKATAGKLLIIGGNAHGFAAPAQAYAISLEAGIGVVRVMLPDAIHKLVGAVLPDADFAPSTPSGSFSKKALAELINAAGWGDGVLLAGELGRNSETAVLLESFVQKYQGLLVLTKDAADYFKETPKMLLGRPQTALVVSLAQLQRIFINTPSITPITYGMDLLQLVEALHGFTSVYDSLLVTKHLDQLLVAYKGQVSTFKLPPDKKVWRVETAARAGVFWLQNPSKPFEAVTVSLL